MARLDAAQIAALGDAGAAAPSPANLQAWKVRVDGGAYEVWLDEARTGTFLDVRSYASIFALGSFAENVRLAAGRLGLAATLLPFPDGEARGPAARFTFAPGAVAADPLADQIAARCTNRQPGSAARIADPTVAALAMELVGAATPLRLHALADGDAQRQLAHAIARGESIRMYSGTMRREMFSEVRWSHADAERARDKLDLPTLELPAAVVLLMRLIRRAPWVMALIPRAALESSWRSQLVAGSHLCCISMAARFTPANLFDAGRAVQRLWLRATALGLSLHPWSIIPYLLYRHEQLDGADVSYKELSGEQHAALEEIATEVRAACQLSRGDAPLFLFRLFTGRPPTARALRRPSREFTSVEVV